MASLQTNFRCACVIKKLITLENNHSCKCKLVIVLRLQIECFSLCIFLFSVPLSPRFIINHPETVSCCNFLFVFTFVGDDFGRELSFKAQRDVDLENKKPKLRWDGFKMGAATLPELSDWALPIPSCSKSKVNLFPVLEDSVRHLTCIWRPFSFYKSCTGRIIAQ